MSKNIKSSTDGDADENYLSGASNIDDGSVNSRLVQNSSHSFSNIHKKSVIKNASNCSLTSNINSSISIGVSGKRHNKPFFGNNVSIDNLKNPY